MSQGGGASYAQQPAVTSSVRLWLDIFKLRIGGAIALVALAGVEIAPGRPPSGWRVAALVLGVFLASAAAGAFNQYYERDLDARMRRTRGRAFVTGRLGAGPEWPVVIALVGASGIVLAWLTVNAVAALYTFLGAFTYGVVYTVWLKRQTRWNIVVGGLAGSFALLAGAAAVSSTGSSSMAPLALVFALVLFLWTPPHFWSFAIAFREDYEAAHVPMLPVVVGEARAARSVRTGAALLLAASLLPCLLGMGAIYGTGALAGGAFFFARSLRLARAPGRRAAMASFHASLVQLVLLLLAAMLDVAMRA